MYDRKLSDISVATTALSEESQDVSPVWSLNGAEVAHSRFTFLDFESPQRPRGLTRSASCVLDSVAVSEMGEGHCAALTLGEDEEQDAPQEDILVGLEAVVVRVVSPCLMNGQVGEVVEVDHAGVHTLMLSSGYTLRVPRSNLLVPRCGGCRTPGARRVARWPDVPAAYARLQGKWMDVQSPQCRYTVQGRLCTRVAEPGEVRMEKSFFIRSERGALVRGQASRVRVVDGKDPNEVRWCTAQLRASGRRRTYRWQRA